MRFSSGPWSGLLPEATLTGRSLSTARLCIHQIIEAPLIAGDIYRNTNLDLVVLLVFGPRPDSRLVLVVLAYGQ